MAHHGRKALVLDDFPLRELILMIAGENVKRMIENRFKSNPQLLEEYLTVINVTLAASSRRESSRIVRHFVNFLDGERPTPDSAARGLSRFAEHSQSTRARYTHTLSAFFFWLSGERLPFKVKSPKLVPQDVPAEDVEALKDYMRKRKTHKLVTERDILIVDTLTKTGMRRGELAALRVDDLVLTGDRPALTVHAGKGAKDRVIPLAPTIRERLANYVRGRPPTDLVFGLASKTVSHKISQWAIKAGVPHIHALYHGVLKVRLTAGVVDGYMLFLTKFLGFLGAVPRSVELATQFLGQYTNRSRATLVRHTGMVRGFMDWYGESLDLWPARPKALPEYVEPASIERIIEAIRSKRTQKRTVTRDVLLIRFGSLTGLRRGELANLTVGDLLLTNISAQ